MIILVDHIRLNGGDGAPGALADAELYIDQAAGLLYVKTESGTYGVPLAVIGLPTPPEDDAVVLVKTDAGADYAVLDGGAGGRPFDDASWRVPGVTPLTVTHATFTGGTTYYALFEMSEAKTLAGQRVVLAGTAGVLFGVVPWVDGAPGAPITSTTDTGTGVIDDIVSADLAPGVYATFFRPSVTVSVQVLDAQPLTPRYSPNFLGYPVALSF